MAKMLVSDYDDTFKTTKLSFKNNIKGVKRFRDKGNLFVIATSRDHKSMLEEVKQHGIEYDYLSCLDGEIIYDKNNHIIYNNGIDKISQQQIENLDKKIKIIDTIIPVKSEEEVLYYNIRPKLFVKTDEIKKELDLMENIRYRHLLNLYQVQPNNIDKVKSVRFLTKRCNIRDEDVFTIGDMMNDYQMIKDYNGFTVYFSSPKLNKKSLGRYLTVNGLMKDIEDEIVNVKRR